MPDKDRPSQDHNALLLTILQAVIQQQRQLKQQLKFGADSTPTSMPQVAGTSAQEPHSEAAANEPKDDVLLAGGLDNLLEFEEKVVESQGKVFNTSSDTVNNLLRGLSCSKESESIKKLTEETANVLPTFAKVLGQSTQSLNSFEDEMLNHEKPLDDEDKEVKVDATGNT